MKNLFRKVASAWSKVPAAVKTQGNHVALTFAVAFVAVAGPALPSIYDKLQVGTFPSLDVLRSLAVAAAAAGLKAAVPAVRAAVVVLVQKYITARKASKAAKLAKAVQEYLTIKAAADQVMAKGTVVPGTVADNLTSALNAPDPSQP